MTPFGALPDGREARLHTLTNDSGLRVDITDYGATIVRLLVPDRDGRFADVVLGYSRVEDYVKSSSYFGAVVGRVANRIGNGYFTLDGRRFTLATNNAPGGYPCHLHGGTVGFDKVLWTTEDVSESTLVLSHTSVDGDEGYPGKLKVRVTYTLGPDNSLRCDYCATTDRATPVSLTQHSYFNLKGEGEGDVLTHLLRLHASAYTPVNHGLIPTGSIESVSGTPFDFTAPRAIGERIDDPHVQLQFSLGYDHNWVIDRQGGGLVLAAEVEEPESGRRLEVWTEEPGVQFYSGNFLDGTQTGKCGHPYGFRNGFCLETQHFPDSVNQPRFPCTILRPGETYRTATLFKFSTLQSVGRKGRS